MRTRATAASTLASYASALRFEDIPATVLRRAKDCVIDTVGAAVYGNAAPAGRIIVQYVRNGQGGRSHILGLGGASVGAEQAALANGVLAHALELDSLRQPGAGVHPGAVLVPAALAIAQEEGLGGRALLTAVVAGCEILFRIGGATKHSAEARGFHAPGLTGPFGAAVAAGHLLGLDAAAMCNALGIAGSLGGGLLEFAASGDGGMVKRLHLGRAAAAGITAARLAQAGFTGPAAVLEGEHGFLHAYCAETDPAALTSGLGERFETLAICFKTYACHITAHTPVHAVRTLQSAHRFAGTDVAAVQIEGTPKMAALHGNRQPADTVAAQYSIAFCVAAALLHDPTDPATFIETLPDPAVQDLCRRVEVLGTGGFASSWTTRTRVRLHDGRVLEAELDDVPGFPSQPFDVAQRRAKFLTLTARLDATAAPLLDRLEAIEDEAELGWLDAAPPRRAHAEA
jgi:2-methylcitrate dehydratase PrpD